MKNNYRRLGAILRMFGAETFNSISIYNWQITALAKFDRKLVTKLINAKFKSEGIDPNGFVDFRRGDIKISLS